MNNDMTLKPQNNKGNDHDKIIFEDMPHGSCAIFRNDKTPTMFLDHDKSPKLYTHEIPPKHEISKKVICTFEELNSTIREDTRESMKEDIRSIAECFLEGGMKDVVIGLYPLIAVGDTKEACVIYTMEYCMVAYDIPVIIR